MQKREIRNNPSTEGRPETPKRAVYGKNLRANFLRIVGILLLAGTVLFFRGAHDTPLGFLCATFVVIAIWGLHSLKISRFNVRAFLLILLLFGIPFVLLRQLPIFSSNEANTGPWTEDSFDPASMGSIRPTHDIAMQVYFDHRPTEDERYFKTATLEKTDDGLHYVNRATVLELSRLPETSDWAEKNLKNKTVDQKIDAIQGWFQKNLSYSLQPGTLRSRQPLDEFLFERKSGYCEHFSAALATLMKISGTRARVVVGFQGGSWNPMTEELTYEMADSHAWVETYNPNLKNWTKHDPTSWVVKQEIRETDNSLLFVFAGGLILVALGYTVVKANRRDPVSLLIAKISKLEHRKQLEASGHTLSERMRRLMNLNPPLANSIHESLTIYQNAYFKNDPSPESRRALRKSIRKWSRIF